MLLLAWKTLDHELLNSIVFRHSSIALLFGVSTFTVTAEERPLAPGHRLALQHCASCHQFPSPNLLPRQSWEFCLTYMGLFLGIDDLSPLKDSPPAVREIIGARREFVHQAGLNPPSPIISAEDWALLRSYYLSSSPTEAIPAKAKPPPQIDDHWFRAKSTPYRHPRALTSLVKIDEERSQLIVHDSLAERLTILDRDGDIIDQHQAPGVALVGAQFRGNDLYLLNIGDLFAARIGKGFGELQQARIAGGYVYGLKNLLTDLHRPSHFTLADIDADGSGDAVISNFGDYTGNLSIYWGTATALTFDPAPTIVSPQPGIVSTQSHDFNHDGLPDLAVLASAAAENLSLYLNQGNRSFTQHLIVAQHPSFGYTALELRDMNGDGQMDIITANGDNGDSDPYNTLKRDQGIRIYLNQGDLKFTESYFYPMYGVFGLEIEDFDSDGDLDIAAVAFHPDFNTTPSENFVILKQTNPLEFEPHSHSATFTGRWMTIASGDLDNDGDKDLVLGAGYSPVGMRIAHEEKLAEMMRSGPALLILENQTK